MLSRLKFDSKTVVFSIWDYWGIREQGLPSAQFPTVLHTRLMGLVILFHVVAYTVGLFCLSPCTCVHACVGVFHVVASGVDPQVPTFLFCETSFLISLELHFIG